MSIRAKSYWRRFALTAIASTVALSASGCFGGGAEPAPQGSAAPRGTVLEGFQQGDVPVNGGTIHYARAGTGPVLVLLHGWPQTWWSWHDVMPTLAKSFTVVAFDLPGLGKSSIPADGYDAATSASRIRQAVQHLGYKNVNILAHDMGVLVAYNYAREYPAEVLKLAALDAPLNGFGLEDLYHLSFHFKLNMSAAPIPENMINNPLANRTYIDQMVNGFSFKPEAVDKEVYYEAYSDPARRTAGYNYYRAWPKNAEDNKANASKRLKMPVLAMGGQYAFGPGVAVSFRQAADQVLEVIAPDSGHNISEENPEFLAACASLFFGGANGQTPPAAIAPCAVAS
jgi:pimeloyl-ACP methyl ester carboxylesterase